MGDYAIVTFSVVRRYKVGIFGKYLNNDNPTDAPPGVTMWFANGGGNYINPVSGSIQWMSVLTVCMLVCYAYTI